MKKERKTDRQRQILLSCKDKWREKGKRDSDCITLSMDGKQKEKENEINTLFV